MVYHTTNLTIGFSEDDGAQALSLEFERFIPVIGNPAGTAILRLYPAVDAELFASRGVVRAGSARKEVIVKELVSFSNTNSATTTKIMLDPIRIEQDWVTQIGDEDDGFVGKVKFTPEDGTKNITCDKTITGVVLVSYTTQYKELEYIMDIEYLGSGSPEGINGIMVFHPATVLAYYEGATASLEVSPPSLTTPVSEQSRELYRVTSNVVVTEDGAWEKPDNWPDENKYASHPSSTGPEVGSPYVEHERVHEIGTVDDFGRYQNITYFTSKRKPFETDVSYTIPYAFVSSYTAEDFTDPSCAVNYFNIRTRLKNVYGFSDSDITAFGCSG